MSTIPDLDEAMRHLLCSTADQLARPSGLVQRQAKLSGPLFAQTLVFGWWANPQATLEQLCLTAAELGCELSPQAIDQRFTPAAASFLQQLLTAATNYAITGNPVLLPLWQRFSAVEVRDTSQISLPQELLTLWQGCGNETGALAALKVLLQFDLLGGGLQGPLLADGRSNDRTIAQQLAAAPGSLQLADLGFYEVAQFAAWDRAGVYFLSRLQQQTAIYNGAGQRLVLLEWLPAQQGERFEQEILLGAAERLGCRLIVERVPAAVAAQRRERIEQEAKDKGTTPSSAATALAAWTLLVTNVGAAKLRLGEAVALGRVRWQIELMFKRWKSLLGLDEWRSEQPWRIMCEVYAKLLIGVLQHWVQVVSHWEQLDKSLWKGTQLMRDWGSKLLRAWQEERLEQELARLAQQLVRRCRINKQPGKPATYQILLEASRFA